MNIEYSDDEFINGQDDIPFHIEKSIAASGQYTRIMHYAIHLSQFFGAKHMPKEHTTSVKDLDLPKLAKDSPEFRKIIESGMYALIGDRIYLYSQQDKESTGGILPDRGWRFFRRDCGNKAI